MRNKIQDKLLEIDPNVYYGQAPRVEDTNEYNYIVFGQSTVRKKSQTSKDLQGSWFVTIVRENYIPDDTLFEVINALEEINGLRMVDGEMNFEYITKPKTNIVVEIVELDFTRTKKAVG